MRSSILLILLMLSFSAFAQNQILSFTKQASRTNSTEPMRNITDEGLNGIQIKYSFSGAHQSTKTEGNQLFQKLYIKNFSHTQDVGLPSLPAHIDFILIPEGATASIELLSAPKTVLENYLIYPALEPASDEYGASEPEFTINTAFYNSNVLYPSS